MPGSRLPTLFSEPEFGWQFERRVSAVCSWQDAVTAVARSRNCPNCARRNVGPGDLAEKITFEGELRYAASSPDVERVNRASWLA